MFKEQEIIFNNSKESFAYFLQNISLYSSSSAFELLSKINFQEINRIYNNIKESKHCLNIVKQANRKNGLTLAINFWLAYELYFNNEKDKLFIQITNTKSETSNLLINILEIFEKIFSTSSEAISFAKKAKKTNKEIRLQNTKLFILSEIEYTVSKFRGLTNKNTKTFFFFDNTEIKNFEKFKGFLNTFYDENFNCIFFASVDSRSVNEIELLWENQYNSITYNNF